MTTLFCDNYLDIYPPSGRFEGFWERRAQRRVA